MDFHIPAPKFDTDGATFVEAGQWLRAQWYAREGEKGWRDSVDREVITTRSKVGICDVTTLGKIDIQGRDAAEFLNRIYSNPFLKVPVGKVRYGLMLREDGIAYDDGTTARLPFDEVVSIVDASISAWEGRTSSSSTSSCCRRSREFSRSTRASPTCRRRGRDSIPVRRQAVKMA